MIPQSSGCCCWYWQQAPSFRFPWRVCFLIGFAVVGVGYAVVMPLVFWRAARDPDTSSGTAIAAVATSGYGGMLLGPVLVGFVAHVTTLAISMSMLAVLAVGVALLARFIGSIAPAITK